MSEQRMGIVLVDDHPVVREGLSLIINAQDDMEILGEASSGEEALVLVEKLKPQLTIVDLKMPGMGGLAVIRRIRKQSPDTRVIVFTTYEDESDIISSIEAGAHGYLLKGSTAAEILGGIRAAARGDSPIDPTAAKHIISKISVRHRDEIETLSAREQEVLELMASGLKNKDIAGKLFITEKTVKAHVGNILRKLEVSDRTAAVATAIKKGIVQI